jgi:GntR family transcriptional regulator
MLKFMKLNRASSVPLHAQIEQALRRMLREPEFRGGQLLPPEVVLAARLRVSRNTLRAAMTRLESEGLLERTPKVGTRVARPKPHLSLTQWHSFTEEMRRQGIAVENFETKLSWVHTTAGAARALGLKPGSVAWQLRRVRGWDGVPTVLAISWLPPFLGITGTEDFSRPLYEVLHKTSRVSPAVSREEINATLAGTAVAEALHITPRDPVLLRSRIILDKQGRPIEYNLNYYRTDRYRLTLDLESPTR